MLREEVVEVVVLLVVVAVDETLGEGLRGADRAGDVHNLGFILHADLLDKVLEFLGRRQLFHTLSWIFIARLVEEFYHKNINR